MSEWKLTTVQAGILGSWGTFGMIFGALAFGPIADRFGKAKALFLSTAVFAIFTGAVGFATSFHQFAVCRFLGGIGLAGAMPIAMAYVSEYSPKNVRSRLVVWVSAGSAIGTIISVLVGMALIDRFGWRPMFYIALIPIILCGVQYYMPESMSFLVKRNEKKKIADVLEQANLQFIASPEDQYRLGGFHAAKAGIAALFKPGFAKNTLMFWFVMFTSYIFGNGFVLWLPILMNMQGWSFNFSLFFTLTYHLGFILGIPLSGWAQDRFGGRVTLQYGILILGALVSCLGFITSAALLSVVLFLCGAARHGTAGVTGSYAAQSYPITVRGTGTTWAYALGRVGGTVGPVATGFLLYLGVPMRYNFMAFSVLLLLQIIAISFTTDYAKTANSGSAAVPRTS
jgi:AAHS family benzoate transporter-like MFS transporter